VVRESSLNRVAALFRTGTAYLGNDSGTSHLAGLSGARGVVAFGPSDPEIWHPLGNGLRVCLAASTACRRCDSNQFCTHVLPIDDVWEALLSALAARLSRVD
jgi:ADP-heptose:LPS heptosyltransferase